MSDYYGAALLEDWLAEEVFNIKSVPPNVVELFEKYREDVESNIDAWFDADDGYGNCLSWRGWGRGFDAIPDDDNFDELVKRGKEILSHGSTGD